ncbi:hypothetical protein LWC33_34110 [Pseudonocardia sp. RS11V-5]|uniref:hypothetical protein n=1 Tax=Pseudonocardia terrae TaxID=2905831 RepID=UPI001E51B73B|nr:hypothetical protein [Pseudonocardia terrae]MCE3556462.1 hypothetical protein [Pseudonocardia terrae]
MVKQLLGPAGEPDRATREIIDGIRRYRASDRDPVVRVRGSRHIDSESEQAWDVSIAKAEERATIATIMAAADDELGTPPSRIRARRAQLRRSAWA